MNQPTNQTGSDMKHSVSSHPLVCLGTFNAEERWRPETSSLLPQFRDLQGDNILYTLDELLFVFCNNENDILITRKEIRDIHLSYLKDLGISFRNIGLNTIAGINSLAQNIDQVILENKEIFSPVFNSKRFFSPYAIVPDIAIINQEFDFINTVPHIDIVKKVNSKLFSFQLRENISKKIGEICCSVEAIDRAVKKFIRERPVLLKEEFGVSGKGNLLLENEGHANRIVQYLRNQEKKGKKTSFVVEPLLKKITDFSCHFIIDKEGSIKILSIQFMKNRGFAFHKIKTGDERFLNRLSKTDYFHTLEKVGQALYREGYFGPVCMDSMVTEEEGIVPIVEINARKSMGLINYCLNSHLNGHSGKSSLMFYNLRIKGDFSYENLFEKLKDAEILFGKTGDTGVMPLTSNSVDINRNLLRDEAITAGRVYFSLITQDAAEEEVILKKLNDILMAMNIKIY